MRWSASPPITSIADDEDAGSSRAGGVYMAFTLLGEAVLLIAFVMLAAGEPSGSLDIRAVVAALPASPWRDAALALLIVGFGMKIALAPLNGWMPLAYTAAPIPAAAVLSGAAVKAGVIGLIRFLPLSAAFPGWGEALAWAGFISAFYGVAIGLTQQDPKTILAYSSISQMGVIAAVIGLGLAGADQGAASDAAFYAANHVLVKAALFLTVGVVPHAQRPRRSLALIVAAALALSLGGLPLTGGALAKLAVKGQLGRRPRKRGRGGVGGRDDGSDVAFPHMSCTIARRAGGDPLRASLVLARAGRRLHAGPLAHVSRHRRRSRRRARARERCGTRSGRCCIGGCDRRRIVGLGGSAPAHSCRRHRRRAGGRLPRLRTARRRRRTPRLAVQAMAGGGPVAPDDRACPRRGGVRQPLSSTGDARPLRRRPPNKIQARPNKIKAGHNKAKARRNKNQAGAQRNPN